MDIKKQVEEVAKEKLSAENLKPKTAKKKILLGVIVLLLGALGFEATNNDFDLGSILSGNSVSDSKIERDANGNLERNAAGDFVTKLLRNKSGDVVPAGTAGAKYTDEYNCDDFSTQVEAQTFFEKAGGVSKDTNRLDGNNDGVACQDLPKSSN
jgi:hypothetical protein